MKIKLGLILLGVLALGESYGITLKEIENQLLEQNADLKLNEYKLGFDREQLIGTKALHFPSLTLNAGVSTGKDQESTVNPYSSAGSPGVSGGPAISGSTGTTQSVVVERDAWTSDISMSYVFFSRFNITANVNSAKNTLRASELTNNAAAIEKRSQLYQLLLEISALRDMQTSLDRAGQVMSRIREQRQRSHNLYGRGDQLQLDTKYYELEHQKARLSGGLIMAREALKDLVPGLKTEVLEKTPTIKISYDLPTLEKIQDSYERENYEIENMNLAIDTYRGYQESTSWERPWVPSIMLTSSYSEQGDFKGGEPSDDYRASILFSFNVFDGFQSKARRAQATLAHQMAIKRKESEVQKNMIYIAKLYTDAMTAKTEFALKNAIAEEKKHKLEQTKIIRNSGAGTELEESLMRLEWVNAQLEAHQANKNYQQSILNLAIKANQFNQVSVIEMESQNGK
ncbi:MAG: TolC family protein [Bdellovibrio sp.]|nr:TolC family protein [Bdellovibrio sp.]